MFLRRSFCIYAAFLWALIGLVGLPRAGFADEGLPDRQKVLAHVTHGEGGRAMAAAVMEGDLARVRVLAESRPDLLRAHVPPAVYPDFAPEGQFGDLLTLAVGAGDDAMLAALLDLGVPANGVLWAKALCLALVTDRLDLATVLLEAGASPDPEHDNASDAPMVRAIFRNSVPMAELLLRYGADPNWRDSSSTTMFQTAVDADAMLVAEVMFAAGGDPYAVSGGGRVPAIGISEPLFIESRPDEAARQRIIARIKASDRPWPPPSTQQIRLLVASGEWHSVHGLPAPPTDLVEEIRKSVGKAAGR